MKQVNSWIDPWPEGFEKLLQRRTPLRNALLIWLEEQGKKIQGSVLHVGSGCDAYRYSRFFPEATRYRNLDLHKHLNVDVVANAENMHQIPTHSENCILGVLFLHQVNNVKATLHEIKRVLKPKGVFLGEFTAPDWSNKTDGVHRWTTDEALTFTGSIFKIELHHQHFEGEKLVSTFIRGVKE